MLNIFDLCWKHTSIATTIVELPNSLLASLINSGFSIAEVLIQTLSAPALSTLFISAKLLIPPPTVMGIKTSSKVLEIISDKEFLLI